MTVRISKRRLVRIITFSIALILLIAAAAFSGYSLAARYRSTIEASYQQALSEFAGYAENLEAALTKGEFANTSASQQSFALELAQESAGAKAAFGRLPLTYGECEKIQKYLSQLGDFSNYAVKKLSKGEALSDTDKENISAFRKYAEKIAEGAEETAAVYGDGATYLSLEEKLESNLEGIAEKAEEYTLDGDFKQIDDNLEDFPSLLYDGPFADQVQQKEPKLLENAKPITKDEALKRAADFMNVPMDTLKYTYTRQGNIPCYVFSTESSYITVTTMGGYVEEMYIESDISEQKISYNQAVEKAASFLEDHGYENMTESYYVTTGNVCTINFAGTQESAVCYSDLVKVGVSLNDGRVLTFNAQGYIMNNHKRTGLVPEINLVDAQLTISERLNSTSSRLCVIPTDGLNEALCYELLCTSDDGEKMLVYVNAKTGQEENMLLLLQTDGGTLVI